MDGRAPQSDPEELPEFHSPVATYPRREWALVIREIRNWYESPPGGEPRGALGILTGEAGIGKTLLIGAVEGALKELGIRSWSTVCFPYQPPLAPLRDLLEGLLEDGDASMEPFVPELRRYLPGRNWPGEEKFFPGLGPELDRTRLCDVIAQTFAEISRREPFVLIVENIQWMDSLSLEALGAFLRIARCRSQDARPPRALVLATLRSEEKDGLEDLLDSRLVSFETKVRGYSREDLCNYALSRGIDLPLAAREGLFQATGGNPFPIQFYLSALHPGEDLDPASLPTSRAGFAECFSRSVLARLEKLEKPERQVLRYLSVLGRPATAETLIGLVESRNVDGPDGLDDASDANSHDVLSRLESRGWVRPITSRTGQMSWTLSGETLGELVLEQLSSKDRAILHAEVGELLIRELKGGRPDGFPVASLAPTATRVSALEIFYHLLESPGHPGLVDIGLQAAKEAVASTEHRVAIEVYEQILEVLNEKKDGELMISIEEELAGLLEIAGFHREAVEIYRYLLARDFLVPDVETRARYLRKTGHLHGQLGEVVLQVKAYHDGLKVLEENDDSLERLKLYAHLARITVESGKVEESLKYLQVGAGLGAGIPLEDNPEYLEIYRLAEEVNFRRKDYVEALAFEERIFKHHSRTGNFLGALQSAEYLGHLFVLRGEQDRGLEYLELALCRARETGSRLLLARILTQLGRFFRSLGQMEEALCHLVEARTIFAEIGCDDIVCGLHLSIAHLHLLLFELDMAVEDVAAYAALRSHCGEGLESTRAVFPLVYSNHEERGQQIARRREQLLRGPGGSGSPGPTVLLSELAELLLDSGQTREAGSLFRDALRGSRAAGNPLVFARSLQRAGRYYQILGERDRAIQFFEKSLKFLGPVPNKEIVGNAYLEVASIFLVQGETGKSYDYLVRSLRLFLDLGDEQGLVITSLYLAELLRTVELPKVALRLVESVISLCRTASLKRWEARAHRMAGALRVEAGDFAESGRNFTRARILLDSLGIPLESAILQLELGWESYRRQKYPAALKIARRGIEVARGLEAKDLLEDFCFLLGVVESALSNKSKNFLRALELLNQALLGAQNRGRPLLEVNVLRTMALIYKDREKEELFQEYQSRADSLADELSLKWPAPVREAVAAHKGNLNLIS